MQESVISISGLSKFYGQLKALDDVTLEIPWGRVGLLGPNGAGKTTLIKVLLGLTQRNAGRVQLLGRDIRSENREVRAQVGYMPEYQVALPGLSAVEMCAYAARLCGLPADEAVNRAHEALNFVGLGDKRYQLVETYSTGQLQRVKLAAALVHDPKLLLLDEPTNGLDPQGRAAMLDLVASLPEERNMAFLLSTHLLKDVERVCDHVVMLDQGRVVRHGSMEEVLGLSPDTYEVAGRPGETEALGQALAQEGLSPVPMGNRLVVRLSEGRRPRDILAAAWKHELQVRHMVPFRRSLQEAFVEAVEGGGES